MSRIRIPRKIKKVHSHYVYYFYDGWWPVIKNKAPFKLTERFWKFFEKMEEVLYSDNKNSLKDFELFKYYWNFHYHLIHKKYFKK